MQKRFSCRDNELMQLIQAGGSVEKLCCRKRNISGKQIFLPNESLPVLSLGDFRYF